ncbi:MAG: 50S ribosomal protein L31 [candidate division CPR1 bacterium GW2011_GWA2_42_17]|uniref:Large ribosomal subunit protein bL31 n=1 Tax=candidate division CPR1 bacterium GW2011_GWA2_42_17 TaxID=1618341 RepID=A0A0G1C2U7_9BACT|nr:MAG: 50S ribosomal protein L31 [candidate division CPR1 bacterium GW2011_GWA2_42_17]
MKPNIHPAYYHDAKVICACGHTFITGSTVAQIHVEICSHCHPFYTGVKKFIDTVGRVERFEKKRTEAKEKSASRRIKPKKTKIITQAEPQRRTLKELMQEKQ